MSTYPILKEWRKNTKQKLVEALGSCCQICSYRKCNQVLELHHIDPTQKDFHMSQMNRQSWVKIKEEASKCILLCANCHREVHAGVSDIPLSYQTFDESLIVSSKLKPKDTPCKVCEVLKDYKKDFCSHACAIKARTKISLDKGSLEKLLQEHKGNLCAIARTLNVSDNTVKKYCVKEELNPKDYR